MTTWETTHGPIPAGAILLIRTGWSGHWGDRAAYLGTDLTGEAAVAELHFPGIGVDAANWLAENRDVVAVGIDTPSIDRGQSVDFGAHVVFSARNIAGFENLTNLAALPSTGSFVVALPMKIRRLRVVAVAHSESPRLFRGQPRDVSSARAWSSGGWVASSWKRRRMLFSSRLFTCVAFSFDEASWF